MVFYKASQPNGIKLHTLGDQNNKKHNLLVNRLGWRPSLLRNHAQKLYLDKGTKSAYLRNKTLNSRVIPKSQLSNFFSTQCILNDPFPEKTSRVLFYSSQGNAVIENSVNHLFLFLISQAQSTMDGLISCNAFQNIWEQRTFIKSVPE